METDVISGETTSSQLGTDVVAQPSQGVTAFAFGDPEPVLDRASLFGMASIWQYDRWYEPPLSLALLARSFHVSPHHASAITLKRNLLAKTFVPSRWLDRGTFGQFAKDYLALGNGYLENVPNLAGRPLRLSHPLAVYMRRGLIPGEFFYVNGWRSVHAFAPDRVFQLREPDLEQEIYGVPEWLAALQSGLLNEAATLFRRRYYLNGSHAGFILYLNEATVGNEDAEAIRTALKDSKGIGNFRNLFVHAPGGKKDGVQLIPISEVAARDEFLGIKDTTRDDVLAAHRVPPQLIGVVPKNSGGFGDIRNAAAVFFANEIEPLQARMLEVNDWLGVPAITFRPYEEVAPPPPVG